MGKRKVGRPSEYKPEYCELATNYAYLGATDDKMSEYFEVSKQTFNAWKNEHPEFLDSIRAGRHEADAQVVKSLYQRAKGYTVNEITLSDVKAEDEALLISPTGELSEETKVMRKVTITVKHILPDPTAIRFWLMNRRPQEWRDKKEIDATLSGAIAFVYQEAKGNDPLPDGEPK